MNRFLKFALAGMAGLSMWACVNNAGNSTTANTNAGTVNTNANATAGKAAPSMDALMALDKQANDAYLKGDGQFFEGFLSDKFAMNDMGRRVGKADVVKMISGVKCDVKSWQPDETKMTMLDPDAAVLVYKATYDGTCTFQGKTEKIPSPVRVASVFVRNGDKWQGIWHGETPISDPKNPAKPPAPAPASSPAANSNSSTANTNTAAAPATDANTDALAAIEKSGWEAWKAHDATKLTELTVKDVSFVNNFGGYVTGQADVVKGWTEPPCDVKSTNLTDISGVTISPTVAFIMFKGTADGACGDMKVLPVWGTSFYVKDGNTWKLAFGFESPA